MITLIDGTGPADDRDYTREMATSFCTQMHFNVPGAIYFRGPSLTGSEVSSIADRAVDAAIRQRRETGSVLLCGYSRGGCAAIITASRLKARDIDVDALFLFDAVDLQFSDMRFSQTITDNVHFVAHARTQRNILFFARNPIVSRWYFINTGRWLDGNGTMHTETFVGTHGAAGGCPWSNVPEDAGCSAAVADWMTEHLVDHGVPITLRG